MRTKAHDRGWRDWYQLERARRRSRRQLSVEPLCALHLKKGLVVPATVADHVIAHRGNPELFWYGQLQSLCKQCHDMCKTADDLRGYSLDLDPLGWPSDPRHPTNASRRAGRAGRGGPGGPGMNPKAN